MRILPFGLLAIISQFSYMIFWEWDASKISYQQWFLGSPANDFSDRLKVIDIVLRNSGTSFNLPHCSYKLCKQSFVNRCLFRDCYWHVLLYGTFNLIWFVIIFLHIIGRRLSVSIKDMLCYVMLCYLPENNGHLCLTAAPLPALLFMQLGITSS